MAVSINRVQAYENFLLDDDATDAAITRVGQIEELSRRELSQEFRFLLPSVPWNAIYAMRNHLVHGYDSIDLPMLWETITEDIPALAKLPRDITSKFECISHDESQVKSAKVRTIELE